MSSRYKAKRMQDHGVGVIRLTDDVRNTEVFIAPSLGNRAYAMNVGGANILHMPARNIAELNELSGIPFLAPWANRIPGGGFTANGKWYGFNESLGVLRLHGDHIVIHGMLFASDLWQVVEVGADADSAWATTRMEFWRYPPLMANWPFAHEYEMSYRLANGNLETSISVKSLSAEPMPISIGFHPYFTIPGVPRSECAARIPARLHVETDRNRCATGEFRPNTLSDPLPLSTTTLDDGFTDLIRNPQNEAVFRLEGGGKTIEVAFGPKWQVGVVYSPPGREFICFEPMAAITNGINLAAEGRYSALQILGPGNIWRESFEVRPLNF